MIGKKVLFVCNYFAPDSTIAAVRTTKLVKYMRQNGVQVDFLAVKNVSLSKDDLLTRDVVGVDVEYAYNSNRFLKIESFVKRILGPLKQKRLLDMSNRERINPKTGHIEFFPFETAYPVIGSVEYMLNIAKQRDYFKSVRKWIDDADEYDFIITSYGDAFCYYVGKYYHKKYPKTKWVFDIRDAVFRYKFTPKYMKPLAISMEKEIWEKADIITGVSNGICARVPKRYRQKVHKITNGYDVNDREGIEERLISKYKLIMTFTGSMYGGLQKLTQLFCAVRDLAKSNIINLEDVEVHYAGTQSASNVFRNQMKEAGIEHLMIDHGKLSRRETLELH